MLLGLLLVLGVGTALSESSAEDSEDASSKRASGFLKNKSAARAISYSSSFGSEDFDSPDIPSDFHARWGINKTWGAKTPHPLLSRRASFENYGLARDSVDSAEASSSEEQIIPSGKVETPTKSPMLSKPNPLTSTKQGSEKIHEPTLKSTISSQTKAPSSWEKQKTTLQAKATQNRPAPKQPPTPTIEHPSSESIKATIDKEVTTLQSVISSEISSTVGQELSADYSLSTPATTRFNAHMWGPPLPKMERNKKRRGMIVLKPPPEDWPEPIIPEDAKPPPAEFGATLPPMGTYIDTRWGRKGKGNAASFASAPYLGHRKIDFVPQYERSTTSDSEPSATASPAFKWRIRGRRDRVGFKQRGGGYLNEIGQEPGFRRDLTVRPAHSKYYIAENTTYLVPTMRNGRPFQRSYFNFRMRPVNVGRAFGPPEPPLPYGQPPPPPHFVPNNPYAQPPFPQFPQGPYPPYPPPPPPHLGPPPPYGQGPPPPHAFGGVFQFPFKRPPFIPRFPPAPPFDPHIPVTLKGFSPPLDSYPEAPPPPPSPYPTGGDLPPIRPFLEGIPTISPIDRGPAPWPRRQVPPEYRPAQPRVPDFLQQEPRNFSGYKGPRRGRAYEQYGKADLRPRHTKFFDEFSVRGTPPRFPGRKGSGFGVEFQTDITVSPDVLGDFFEKRTWPTRANKYGYEPYRRSDDRKRPYGFGRYAVQRPPVLGDFGDYKPYRRVDDAGFVPFNFSRPTRSYTFPPRLRLAIKNASSYRRSFRRSSFRGYTLPTLPSIGLAAYMAQDHDYHGNLITPKGRITNLEDLKKLFSWVPEVENVTAGSQIDEKKAGLQPRMTAKPKGMTAREAMRAAAREAIREGEMEAWERGLGGKRRGWRRVGGSGGGLGSFVRRGGARGSGMSPRNFRRAKRSVEEEAEWLKRQQFLQHRLDSRGDYLTGPGVSSSSESSPQRSKTQSVPLRMHRWRAKGRPLRHG